MSVSTRRTALRRHPKRSRPVGEKSERRAAFLVLTLTLLCLIPFVGRPFNIDEPLFIWTAEHIQSHPGDPYGFEVNWYGVRSPMSATTKNPPLASYYIALIAGILGWSEVALHLAFLLPAAMSALGAFCLARRLCARPLEASLASVLTPVFLTCSSTIMCDVMMLAFWVWAVFFWLRGIEDNSRKSLVISAFLIALSALTKYYGMALIPLLAAYALARTHRLGMWAAYMLIPAAILCGYQLWTTALYGRGLLLDAAEYASAYRNVQGLVTCNQFMVGLSFMGGCVATATLIMPLIYSRKELLGWAAVLVGICVFVPIFLDLDHIESGGFVVWPNLVQYAIMATGGISLLVLAVLDLWKHRDAGSLLLLLWIGGTFVFASLINWTVNARSLLPMAPAAGILLVRRLDDPRTPPGRRTRGLAPVLAASALLSLLVTYADYSLASTARNAAVDITEDYKGERIIFQGHWGFQYYMQKLGAEPVDFNHPELRPGDILVAPTNNVNVAPVSCNIATLCEVREYQPMPWIAVLCREVGAGLYASICGPTPFLFGRVPPEAYQIFLVR